VVPRGVREAERRGARVAEEGAVREREPRQRLPGLERRCGAPCPADGGKADAVDVGREAA